jgi:ketosteroid isomerase-like protein
MRRRSVPLLLPLALIAGAATAASSRQPPSPVAEVVAAERAFAARAQEVDARDAFAEHFAPDALWFAPPGPVFPALTQGPPWGTNIRWRPVDAGIARSADFGWTTGPAEYRKDKADAAPYRWGFYTSVWMRQPDGRWKVAIDGGITTPQPTMAVPDWRPDTALAEKRARQSAERDEVDAHDEDDEHDHLFDRRHAVHDQDHDDHHDDHHGHQRSPEQRVQELLKADRRLAARASEHAADAFGKTLLRDARFHRDGKAPAVGRTAALGLLRDGAATYAWAPAGARVATSGEIGYSYGSGEKRTTTGAQPFHYLAIWEKRDGHWKLGVLVHSMPKPRPASG